MIVGHGKTCPYCGRIMNGDYPKGPASPTRDHIIPRSRGGRKILICCAGCNVRKGSIDPIDWLEIIYSENKERGDKLRKIYERKGVFGKIRFENA